MRRSPSYGKQVTEVGEPSENDRNRYVHFRAPDGKLYELVESRRSPARLRLRCRALEALDLDLLHAQHRLHDTLRLLRIGIA